MARGAHLPWKVGLLLALLPLAFTGKAFVRGDLYGPADLYYAHDPWKPLAAASGVDRIHNAILSDLAFANLPWRAAVREAAVHGRLPLWNRFVLAGNPLLGAAQAGAFHPGTWLGLALPLALSWTFSCAFTIFLALGSAYLFFRELCRSDAAALVGAVGWGFSTYVIFWDGWAVGPSVAVLPLVLLGVRRIAREGGAAPVGVTAAALLLSFLGGHPETFFHVVAVGGAWFLFELFARDARKRAAKSLGGALAAGAVAIGLSAPVLFPLLEGLPQTAEYAARREAVASGRSDQSVSASEAASRLLPAVLPFAHGIYGKSPVQELRRDGSGMPLAYAGALLFPLAALGVAARRAGRERWILFVLFLAGVAYGASAPLLLDATSMLPGFALALNYRLVFLAPLGLSGLAALGVEATRADRSARRLGAACATAVGLLVLAFVLSTGVFRDRGLSTEFVRRSFASETAPILALAGLAFLRSDRRRDVPAAAALVLLGIQRFQEMRGTYPTLPSRSLAPPIPTLAALPASAEPYRVVAVGEVFRPNAAALYGLEDVRGYESIVLARFAETWPLWSRGQHASFNRVDDASRPFLSFLNARFSLAGPDAPAPVGWKQIARDAGAALFESPSALPRAFAPRRVRAEPDARRRLAEMGAATDFADVAWVAGAERSETSNGRASVSARARGADLLVDVDVEPGAGALVATSLPDWPGWRAEADDKVVPLATVNHAFVGFRLPAGRHSVRLAYRPASFFAGSVLAGSTAALVSLLAVARTLRRRANARKTAGSRRVA